jgi:predicted transglutaminase-like cysteine proteinase
MGTQLHPRRDAGSARRTTADHGKLTVIMNSKNWHPRVGEWVEVRSVAEILGTLDGQGDGAHMPFMPEMLRFAGQRFAVSASAHKTCDTVNKTGGRRVRNTVHLADLRCDGSAHGGCQAACLLFWKTSWLKPASSPAPGAESHATVTPGSVPAVLAGACSRTAETGATVYRCQATTLPQWSEPLSPYSLAQYWEDIRFGNATLGHALGTLVLAGLFKLRKLPFAFRFNRWLYDRAHRLLRGIPDPHLTPRLAGKADTPDVRIGLQVGDVVRIRPLEEINATINERMRNRGLHIDEEMTRYCGLRTRVTDRVSQIINEQTGEMMHFKNPCIVLDNTECLGEYSENRLLCPRKIKTYWREAWLDKVEGPAE